jgi:hypothetical protein
VTFDPGETTAMIEIVVNGDVDAEVDEYFVVSLHDAVNGFVGGYLGLAFGGITNDD